MAEETGAVTDLSRRFAERQSRFREAMGTEDGGSELTLEQILEWADAYHADHGTWPDLGSGEVAGGSGESWRAINFALAMGKRGLPGDSSLAELLSEHRGAPLPDMGPKALAEKIWAWEQKQFPLKGPRRRHVKGRYSIPLTLAAILGWADAFRACRGRWPTPSSGAVEGSPGLSWNAVNDALRRGGHGLPGGTTLSRLIQEQRDPESGRLRSRLTIEQVLAWMDAHRASTGRWPSAFSGQVRDAAPGLSWHHLDQALRNGSRGLPKGWSVARIRGEYREARLALTVENILAWADGHHAARGCWPTLNSGRIIETSRETWALVDDKLRYGGCGLPGGQTLARLLLEHRGVRVRGCQPPLRVEQILAWADVHHTTHCKWPTSKSGPVDAVPGESWRGIDRGLRNGWRGLPGGSTLSRLLAEHRGTPARRPAPKLTVEQILAWSDAHHKATGKWPGPSSGDIAGTQGERWSTVNNSLRRGNRGLPQSASLSELLASRRRVRCRLAPPPLTIEQILVWADSHHVAHGRWPTNKSGQVPGAPGESWHAIYAAIAAGRRGLSGGTTLSRLLATHRPTRHSPLTLETIRTWAQAHQAATGSWPTRRSGPVLGMPGEFWGTIDRTLRQGRRGLPGGSSLKTLKSATGDRPPQPPTTASSDAGATVGSEINDGR